MRRCGQVKRGLICLQRGSRDRDAIVDAIIGNSLCRCFIHFFAKNEIQASRTFHNDGIDHWRRRVGDGNGCADLLGKIAFILRGIIGGNRKKIGHPLGKSTNGKVIDLADIDELGVLPGRCAVVDLIACQIRFGVVIPANNHFARLTI